MCIRYVGYANDFRRILFMKITKLLSAATAAVIAVSSVAVSASADYVPVTDGTDWLLADSTGNFGICLYSDGTNKDGVPVVDFSDQFDISDVAHVAFTLQIVDDGDNRDYWDGSIGGSITVSAHSDKTSEDPALYSKYNWTSNGNFWGVIDEDLGLETLDDTQAVQAVKVDDYTYKIEGDIENPLANDDLGNPTLVRLFLQAWSFELVEASVIETDLSDANGNLIASFDAKGNITLGSAASASEPVEEEAAADDTAAEDTAAEDTAAATTTTSADKGSPDTGVEGIAAVAGAAIVAAGALLLSKKRK
jgi:hypothetical protein